MMNSTKETAFRTLVTAGWANVSDGDTKATTGFFAMIDMTTERPMMTQVLVEAGIEPQVIDRIESGWYMVTENDDGLIFIAGPQQENRVSQWYEAKAAEYAAWSLCVSA